MPPQPSAFTAKSHSSRLQSPHSTLLIPFTPLTPLTPHLLSGPPSQNSVLGWHTISLGAHNKNGRMQHYTIGARTFVVQVRRKKGRKRVIPVAEEEEEEEKGTRT